MNHCYLSAVFNHKNRLDKSGRASVVIRAYFPKTKKRIYLDTGFRIESNYWDSDSNRIKKSYPNWRQLEQTIKRTISEIEAYESELIQNNKELQPEHLDIILNKKQRKILFLDFYEEILLTETHLKRGTQKEHRYTYNLLKEFSPSATLNEIDYSFAKRFDSFLRDVKKLKQNTIHKHHQHVRRFFSEAKKTGIITQEPTPGYSVFKSKKEKSDRVALTFNELLRFEKLEPENKDSTEAVRDLFLFSCYTGLRFEDVRTLTPAHLFTDAKETYIRKRMEKVDKNITLNISVLFNGKALALIDKYKEDKRETCFPKYENQHVNRVLKTLAIGTGIKINLSFHIARHTFGTILAEKTQNPYLIMELMGHADIKTSMIYIHYSLERINQQIKLVNWDADSENAKNTSLNSKPNTENSNLEDRVKQLEKLLMEKLAN